jgi:hypothetical protein
MPAPPGGPSEPGWQFDFEGVPAYERPGSYGKGSRLGSGRQHQEWIKAWLIIARPADNLRAIVEQWPRMSFDFGVGW